MKDDKQLWAVVAGATDQFGTRYSEALANNDLNLLLIDSDKSMLQTSANRLYKEYNVGVEILCLNLNDDFDEVILTNRLNDIEVGVFVPHDKNKKIDEMLRCKIKNIGTEFEILRTDTKEIYVARHLAEHFAANDKLFH